MENYREGIYISGTEYDSKYLNVYISPGCKGVFLLTTKEWENYVDERDGYWSIGVSSKIEEIVIDGEMLGW